MTDSPDRRIPRIVCAAYRYPDGLILASPRHGTPLLYLLIDKLEAAGHSLIGYEEQGFVDQFGTFYTREEAWVIAEAQGQILHKGDWGTGCLYSENLY